MNEAEIQALAREIAKAQSCTPGGNGLNLLIRRCAGWLVAFVLLGAASLGGWGYLDLSGRKVDEKVFHLAVENMKERIEEGFASLRRELRAALRGSFE